MIVTIDMPAWLAALLAVIAAHIVLRLIARNEITVYVSVEEEDR